MATEQEVGADRALVASATKPVSRLGPTGGDHGEIFTPTDAHLNTAARELYHALDKLVGCATLDFPATAYLNALAALAKARGEV